MDHHSIPSFLSIWILITQPRRFDYFLCKPLLGQAVLLLTSAPGRRPSSLQVTDSLCERVQRAALSCSRELPAPSHSLWSRIAPIADFSMLKVPMILRASSINRRWCLALCYALTTMTCTRFFDTLYRNSGTLVSRVCQYKSFRFT